MSAAWHELTLTVLDRNGNIRSGAVVCIVQSPSPMPEVARRTNAQGQCRMRLSAGRYVIEAHVENIHARQAVNVPEQAHVEMRLQ
jgi:hypothetical protein